MKSAEHFVDTSPASIALAEARAELVRLRGAWEPGAYTTQQRVDALTRELQAQAPKTMTLQDVELQARARVERELFDTLATRHATAERAVDAAAQLVRANDAEIDAVPSFLPVRRQNESDAAWAVNALRAELTLRDVRTELRELPVDKLVAAHRQAHDERDWLMAWAADAELRRLLRGLGRGFGDGDALVAGRGRVQAELERTRQARRALVPPDVLERHATNTTALADVERDLHARDLLLQEYRRTKRFPLASALKGR